MSDRPVCIVRAQPPKNPEVPLWPLSEVKRELVPLASTAPALTSLGAIEAFRTLVEQWRMPPARAWRLLTGVGYQAGSLSPEQVTRVDALLTIDSAMHGIALGSVGEWMLKPNAAPLFAGSAPADYLTHPRGRAGIGGGAAAGASLAGYVD